MVRTVDPVEVVGLAPGMGRVAREFDAAGRAQKRAWHRPAVGSLREPQPPIGRQGR